MQTPALELLLTGYFHEDCIEDFGDERGVVTAFMGGEPALAPFLVSEIDAVLRALPDDDALADFVLGFRSPWGPTREESRPWLQSLREYAVQASDSR